MTPAYCEPGAIIFLHVPKAAGSTLNRLIEWEYPVAELYSIDPFFYEWSWQHLHRLSRNRLRKIRIFKGHMRFGLHAILPQTATYITVLREPVDRLLSSYYFMRSYRLHPLYWKFRRENWTLEQFVHRYPRHNVQCKMIAGVEYTAPFNLDIYKTAKDNLKRYFSVVGLTERFEESLALMKLRFGWNVPYYKSFNVSRTRPKLADISRSILNLIEERNAFDISLYEYAAKWFQSAVNAHSADISRVTRELEATRTRTRAPAAGARLSIEAAARKAINRIYSAL